MRIGDLTTGATKLRLAMQNLQAIWAETSESWRDATAEALEENYLQVLAPKVKGAMEAAGRLANVMTRAQQELES
jgi:hypothetical protein